MVVAGKVFRLTEDAQLAEVASKLEGYRVESLHEEGEIKLNLVTEVVGLAVEPNMLKGIFSHDYVTHVFHRGKVTPSPRTVEALFSLTQLEGAVFLTIVERKRLANFIANKLSIILFNKVGGVVEARIPPEALRMFHNRNPEETKITFFDNVDIPNVDKLSLYGSDLNRTPLFEEYCKRGDLWYIVARDKDYGYVVGVTRDASVTIFNITDKTRYLEYVAKQIYPLILQSPR